MSDTLELRAYSYIDRMQPQYASFVGTVTQGDLPTEGMAALYVEMAPGNHVFRVVDVAVKATEARPGAQIVERQYGMFELHSHSQAEVLQAGEVVLQELGLTQADRLRPKIASLQVITNVSPYQSQLLNRFTRGMMLVAGQTMLVVECTPAAYINYASNEAEKAETVNLMLISSLGVYALRGMAGMESDIVTARDALGAALEVIQWPASSHPAPVRHPGHGRGRTPRRPVAHPRPARCHHRRGGHARARPWGHGRARGRRSRSTLRYAGVASGDRVVTDRWDWRRGDVGRRLGHCGQGRDPGRRRRRARHRRPPNRRRDRPRLRPARALTSPPPARPLPFTGRELAPLPATS